MYVETYTSLIRENNSFSVTMTHDQITWCVKTHAYAHAHADLFSWSWEPKCQMLNQMAGLWLDGYTREPETWSLSVKPGALPDRTCECRSVWSLLGHAHAKLCEKTTYNRNRNRNRYRNRHSRRLPSPAFDPACRIGNFAASSLHHHIPCGKLPCVYILARYCSCDDAARMKSIVW